MQINSKKSDRKYGKILGISLNGTSTSSVLSYVKYRIQNNKKFSIVTPNPEIVLASTHDRILLKALNNAELALPDGVGLSQANMFLTLSAPNDKIARFFVCVFQGVMVGLSTFFNKDWLTNSLNIFPGRKVFLDLISLANKNSWKVFLLGGTGGVSEKVSLVLKKKYKKIIFEYMDGPKLNKNGVADTKVDRLIQKGCEDAINKFRPELLFVAFGPGKQEKWIFQNLSKLNVGGAMAVGGTFNYVAGVSKFPPDLFTRFGLEWFWRVLTEPWRIGRIYNAVIVFPWKVFLQKLSQN